MTEYERAVIFRLGRLRKGGSKGPGIFTIIPCIDTYRCVDLRTVSFDVPPQEVRTFQSIIVLHSIGKGRSIKIFQSESLLTCLIDSAVLPAQILSRDSVTVSVDAVVYFNVIDAEQALCSVDDFRFGSHADCDRSIDCDAVILPLTEWLYVYILLYCAHCFSLTFYRVLTLS